MRQYQWLIFPQPINWYKFLKNIDMVLGYNCVKVESLPKTHKCMCRVYQKRVKVENLPKLVKVEFTWNPKGREFTQNV